MDLTTIEVTKNSLVYISDEMAVALRKAAFSPNIRERADHSCAILDAQGRTLGQAEQIPVHIGSLPFGLRNTLDWLHHRGEEPRKGDMFVVNDPYISGTHLNDVTLIRPVFMKRKLVGFVANKAHHVDVGGMVPGSISPDATEIYQEGVIIPPVRIMKGDRVIKEVSQILESNSRVPEISRGDLRAQIAANLLGERRLVELAGRVGAVFDEVCEEVLELTRRLALSGYSSMPEGSWQGEDFVELDDQLLSVRAKVRISGDGFKVDFSGTHTQVRAPLNAVMGVTIAAVTFAAKTLLPADVPLNDGFTRTIQVSAPAGTMVNPVMPAPVAAGNLETSQRIVDVVYKALSPALKGKIPAAAHGSMNNLLMGGVDRNGKSWAFYETIGGGSGARLEADGESGVQVNMTNTMNTPIEVMEHYYPISFESYKLRKGSGGDGKWVGGLGIERSFRAKGEITTTVIGDRSRLRPWGLEGGGSGKSSQYTVIRKGGRIEKLKSKETVLLHLGDTLVMRTPGGGGYGFRRARH